MAIDPLELLLLRQPFTDMFTLPVPRNIERVAGQPISPTGTPIGGEATFTTADTSMPELLDMLEEMLAEMLEEMLEEMFALGPAMQGSSFSKTTRLKMSFMTFCSDSVAWSSTHKQNIMCCSLKTFHKFDKHAFLKALFRISGSDFSSLSFARTCLMTEDT